MRKLYIKRCLYSDVQQDNAIGGFHKVPVQRTWWSVVQKNLIRSLAISTVRISVRIAVRTSVRTSVRTFSLDFPSTPWAVIFLFSSLLSAPKQWGIWLGFISSLLEWEFKMVRSAIMSGKCRWLQGIVGINEHVRGFGMTKWRRLRKAWRGMFYFNPFYYYSNKCIDWFAWMCSKYQH